MNGEIVIVKSGGDIASGVIQKIHRSGFRVLVLETEFPTVVRRTASLAEAIYEGRVELEGIKAVHAKNAKDIYDAWSVDDVPIFVDPDGNCIEIFKPIAVVDAIIAKINTGMHKGLAPITIAIGPGFEASKDCDVVIESNRGHNLGRLIYEGQAEKNTGVPGKIAGFDKERVLYAPDKGIVKFEHKIGDVVKNGDVIGYVNNKIIIAKLDGLVRGLIKEGTYVKKGFKIGDIDPRIDEINNCYTISDKARAIGGGVLEAIMIELGKKSLSTIRDYQDCCKDRIKVI